MTGEKTSFNFEVDGEGFSGRLYLLEVGDNCLIIVATAEEAYLEDETWLTSMLDTFKSEK